ncbi:uncharacterized protein BKCO1_8000157 [Diplodia corticola]|uniref:Uncharacterized protein n=1 Tax=Diplodia corticola TaxID=236234 RepID=A0A1J9SBK1_9PEZI|nr:uncharacterized protein BKCO1_8000157 [Diplodia corticola]OJD37220.1 hypothetical protein BKCO1_8000157 [Diplodia corticola]
MSSEKSDFLPPSYEQSFPDRPSASGGQHIIDHLTSVRAQHMREIVDAIVYPRIEEQAIYGIANTTIALIPSDAVPEKPVSEFDFGDAKGSVALELVGFASDETVQQVRLKGPLNKTQFWHQPGVVEEFRRTLQGTLATAPFAPVPTQDQPSSPASASPVDVSTAPKSRKLLRKQGLSGRTSSGQNVERAAETVAEQPASGLHARVALEQICFRTVSDFGLYETIDRPAVVVRVVAGL